MPKEARYYWDFIKPGHCMMGSNPYAGWQEKKKNQALFIRVTSRATRSRAACIHESCTTLPSAI